MDHFPCDACQKIFANIGNLNKHKKSCSAREESSLNCAFSCNFCEKTFHRKDSLKRHNEDCHSVNESVDFQCPICKRSYQSRNTLFRHIEEKHIETALTSKTNAEEEASCSSGNQSFYLGVCIKCNESFYTTQEFAKHHMECVLAKRKKTLYPRECSKCKIKFDTKQMYSNHLRKCVVEEAFQPKNLKKSECIIEGCTLQFFHRTRMLEHLEKAHMKDTQAYEKTFDSYHDFQKWKEQIEGDTCSSYTAPCGLKKGESYTYRYFTCQLEALDSPHAKTGACIRKTSRVWTKKERIPKGLCCPARILVKEDNVSGQVVAKLIESHNHPIDYAHSKYRRVPKSIRDTIIALLSLEMTPIYIKNFLRRNVDRLNQRDRQIKEHFVSEVYIRRIKYNLKLGHQFHHSDVPSLDIIVRNLIQTGNFGVDDDDYDGSLFSPITVYKPQGQNVVLGNDAIDCLPNSNNLFLLGIQSREQLLMLKQGAKTVVCIDFTYKLTQYDFYLCNIIVLDEFGKGYPVAHFITNRQDMEILSLVIKYIKVRCPDLFVNFLMTDDQSEWQAMEMAFGDMRWGICKYSLFRAWQRRLQSKDGIADLQLRREVFQALTVLCHERHQPTFSKMMEAFIAKYRPLCDNFVSFFVKEYAFRPQVWALSYRNFPDGYTDTNIYCESFHNKIKTFYLESEQNGRVDNLVKIVFETEVDRYLEHLEMRLEERSTSQVPISQAERHSRGLGISDADVSFEEGSNFWVVRSQTTDGAEYYVTRYRNKCHLDHCFESCPQPACSNLCSHLYTCTCPDPSGICKHIHKVHSLMVRLNENQVLGEELFALDFDGELQVPSPVENDESNQEDEDSLISQEEYWRAKCLNYLDKIRDKIISSSSTPMLQFMANQLRIIDGHCDSMLIGSHSDQLEKIIPLLSDSGPQEVVSYKDLSKSEKFKGSKHNLLSKPSLEERNKLKRNLVSSADRVDGKRIRNMDPNAITVNDFSNTLSGIDEIVNLANVPTSSVQQLE